MIFLNSHSENFQVKNSEYMPFFYSYFHLPSTSIKTGSKEKGVEGWELITCIKVQDKKHTVVELLNLRKKNKVYSFY